MDRKIVIEIMPVLPINKSFFFCINSHVLTVFFSTEHNETFFLTRSFDPISLFEELKLNNCFYTLCPMRKFSFSLFVRRSSRIVTSAINSLKINSSSCLSYVRATITWLCTCLYCPIYSSFIFCPLLLLMYAQFSNPLCNIY